VVIDSEYPDAIASIDDEGAYMRTTIDIEDDVLLAAKEMARRQNRFAGQVVSQLLREALLSGSASERAMSADEKGVGRFRPFPPQGVVIANESGECFARC